MPLRQVYLCDIKQEFADGGKAKIQKGLDKRVAKGKMDQAAADKLIGKIQTGLNGICTDADPDRRGGTGSHGHQKGLLQGSAG
jgi:3-hydroxybutyryl-CoA dehydrogenase